MSNISVGSDPEFFLTEGDTIVSSIGRVGGSKEEYMPISENCSLHEDNVAMEITFPEASSESEFVKNIMTAKAEALSFLKDRNLGLSSKASHIFEDTELDNFEARRFGCDPDYNALTGKRNEAPDSEANLRSCGGHVAIGYRGFNEDMNKSIVLILDILIGLPSVILDKDTDRRELYGKASAYRNKDFGLEYRSLSNFWVFEVKYIRWIYQSACQAVEMAISGFVIDKSLSENVSDIINKGDKKEALKLIKELKVNLP